MNEEKRPLKVFLCHAHGDKDQVRELYLRLKKDGVDAWLDKAKLLPGQDWELEIRRAVREADVVVVCLSKQFNQAGFRQKEVRLALDTAMEKPEGEIFIIPARLEECDTLESLRKWHWVDLFEEDGYEMLMRALRARADKIGVTLQVKKIWLPKTTTQPIESRIKKGDTKKQENTKLKIPRNSIYLIGILILLVIVISIFGFPSLLSQTESNPTVTNTKGFKTLTSTLESKLSTSTFVPEPTFTFTATPLPTEITDAKGITMRLVSAGEFTMGSDAEDAVIECQKFETNCQLNRFNEEEPPHTVYLDAFYMDIYEVTNARYQACVEAGGCTSPRYTELNTRSDTYYGNLEFDNYPMIYVDWNQAQTYCKWRDASLPAESQWEKAARGTDGRIYPWGEVISCNQANYYDGNKFCVRNTTEVGSYENGKSPYGIYDMAGNVWEWTADWYSDAYYKSSPTLNPLGPDTGQYRVARGGAWINFGYDLRVSARYGYNPGTIHDLIGFRCAKNATP